MPYPSTVDTWVLTGVLTASQVDQTPTAGTKNGVSVSSDEFDNIPVAGANSIFVQARETGLNSNSIDVKVHASADGTNFDSTSHPYASMNYDGDTDAVKSMAVTPGPTNIRIRTGENEGATLVGFFVTVVVTWE